MRAHRYIPLKKQNPTHYFFPHLLVRAVERDAHRKTFRHKTEKFNYFKCLPKQCPSDDRWPKSFSLSLSFNLKESTNRVIRTITRIFIRVLLNVLREKKKKKRKKRNGNPIVMDDGTVVIRGKWG